MILKIGRTETWNKKLSLGVGWKMAYNLLKVSLWYKKAFQKPNCGNYFGVYNCKARFHCMLTYVCILYALPIWGWWWDRCFLAWSLTGHNQWELTQYRRTDNISCITCTILKLTFQIVKSVRVWLLHRWLPVHESEHTTAWILAPFEWWGS